MNANKLVNHISKYLAAFALGLVCFLPQSFSKTHSKDLSFEQAISELITLNQAVLQLKHLHFGDDEIDEYIKKPIHAVSLIDFFTHWSELGFSIAAQRKWFFQTHLTKILETALNDDLAERYKKSLSILKEKRKLAFSIHMDARREAANTLKEFMTSAYEFTAQELASRREAFAETYGKTQQIDLHLLTSELLFLIHHLSDFYSGEIPLTGEVKFKVVREIFSRMSELTTVIIDDSNLTDNSSSGPRVSLQDMALSTNLHRLEDTAIMIDSLVSKLRNSLPGDFDQNLKEAEVDSITKIKKTLAEMKQSIPIELKTDKPISCQQAANPN